MKTFIFLCCSTIFALTPDHVISQNSKIKIEEDKILSVDEVFDLIMTQTDYRFFYEAGLFEDAPKVPVKKGIIRTSKLLRRSLSNANINIIINDDNEILIKEKEVSNIIKEERQQQVSGTVTDANGQPLPGANILEKGTTNGTQTDFDGNFSISVGDQNAVLVISYLGFKSKEVTVDNQTTLTISLEEDTSALDEVVVTAFGIEREKKALGYAVEEVKGEEVANTGSSNVLTSLQGKGAGINITNTGAGVTGSTSIVLRGGSSLEGSNEALIVVDGVPFSNASFSGGDIDFGSGIADLNPQDIESISILKGANAGALYGSRALNGVVMITTKKGKSGKPQVSFSSQLRLTEIMYFPEIQNEYGAGSGSPDRFGLFLDDNGQAHTALYDEKSWGPRLNQGQLVRQDWLRDQPILPWVSHGDQHKDFFQTAVTSVQNLNVTGGSDKLNYNLSMLYEDAEDVQPESTQDRYNIALRLGSDINDYVGLESRVSYSYSKTHNRPTVGGRESVYYTLLQMPRSISLNDLRPHRYPFSGQDYSHPYFRDGNKVAWNRGRNNPYWTVFEDQNNDVTKRIIGFGKVNLNLLNDPEGAGTLTGFARVGWDNREVNFETIRARSEAYTLGSLNISKHSFLETNTDFYLTYQKNLGKVGVTANFGGNRRYDEANLHSAWGSNFKTDDRTSTNNLENRDFESRTEKKALNSLYGSAQLSYDNYLFLDITGRNDWSSVLPAKNRSYFYPSFNLGFIATDAFDALKSDVLQYAKFRASYAEVGNDLPAYRFNTYYNYGTDPQGRLQATVQNTLGNENIDAEINKSLELGADFRFLKNRIGLDLAWYRSVTVNQIIGNYPQAISTGYTNLLFNVGEISNTGLELSLTTKPIVTDNWNWNLNFNYATNEMVLEELNLPGEAYFRVEDHIEYSSRAYVGQKFGDIYGYRYLRDNNGTVIVNEQGYPIIDNRKGSDSEVKVGNIQPDFTASIQSALTYKNVSLSFLIDGSFGGDVFSGTKRELNRNGYSKESLEGREGWIFALDNDPRNLRELGDRNVGSPLGGYDRWVGNSVFGVFDDDGFIVLDDNGNPVTGAPNEGDNAMYINPERYWGEAARQGYRAVAGSKDGATEEYLEDATFVKLRELNLTYNLPNKWLKGTGFEAVSISAIGRNLFYFNNVSDFFDPDAYRKGTAINSLGYERNGALPSMRTYMFNLRVKF
ncbi:SusC/RagA family TonB-linked outer membrane protein [Tamlana sp. 2201CG12-4]|uniref:SusC/RagA family TonB-linked outer membrane protein n=1 Tax=Tamlana sp. 2201CG12-4 TaxID=3112582 RepID=UPI002DB57E04|nr:SusC/RagA family TonB-linked outer membrane protein [Tamlana sp. 2201CG12-4]MEC3908497.1 SusC/RagA family TonB-linked outer membrane protein [Tamlana sp. 2201CG12-4]